MLVDCKSTSVRDLYKLLISTVVPRPIAWISSTSKAGKHNLAPFSFFNAFSVDPPILGIGIGAKRGVDDKGNSITVKKDTLNNIEETKEFVVHIVESSLSDQMVKSSANFKSDESEIEKTLLTPLESNSVNPPRIKECKLAMECELFEVVPLGSSNLVLGKILTIHIDDSVYKDGEVLIDQLKPIGRLGGISYCQVDSIFDIERPAL